MIDIWLVLCQIFPFAEVVLLTAMEYHRRDEEKGGNGNIRTVQEMDAEQQEVKESEEEEESKRCWIPQLKTLGDVLWLSLHHFICFNCRETSSAVSDVGKFLGVLCSCNFLLF